VSPRESARHPAEGGVPRFERTGGVEQLKPTQDIPMTSSRPYLVRAVYEWISDNSLTPQLVVNAEIDGIQVPRQFVTDGQIVLNISDRAVQHLVLGTERIEFSARFGGVVYKVSLPVSAILAVIARENGAGMSFPEEEPAPEPPGGEKSQAPGKPALRVVK
jgi:stringent starvation protein B